MKIEFIHFLELFLGSLLLFVEIAFLNKVVNFKGKSFLSFKKVLGNNLNLLLSPKNYFIDTFVFVFISLASAFLIVQDGKLHQVILLFSIADLLINQKQTSLAHLSNTLLICVFIGLNNVAPVSLLFVQLIFFIFYAINKGKDLKLVSVASHLVFFLSCLLSLNVSVEYLVISKTLLFVSFPFLYLFVLHFVRSTPTLKPLKIDSIMWTMVMLGSLKGIV
ncbi:MAG: hypothetical protein ACJAT2_002403 [Bacteriovoracaceae bacterium]|jgi:hypothetical protein